MPNPPVPTRLKILRGNPGKRPLNRHEPQPKLGVPDMPEWLSKDAKTEWKRITPILHELGLLALLDQSAIAAYCQAHAEMVAATRTIEKEGRIQTRPILSKHGEVVGEKLVTHPAVSLQRDAMRLVKQFLGEFGLSPASRTRLQIKNDDQNKKENPLEALIRRAAGNQNASG